MQILFALPGGRKYVHCGDMRFSPQFLENSQLQQFVGADAVFLDTTYCNIKHQFPPQARHLPLAALSVCSAHSLSILAAKMVASFR